MIKKRNYYFLHTAPLSSRRGVGGEVKIPMKHLTLFLLLLTLFSCAPKSAHETTHCTPIDSLSLRYAEGFSVHEFKDYKQVIVYSPWVKGTEYARYYLVTKSETATPTDGVKVKIPLQTLVATSATHFEFLSLLGELNTINGICSPELVYNAEIKKRASTGQIADLGDAFNINVEKTLQLSPQAVMMSGYNQNDPYALRVKQAQIPVLFNNEWMETSLLGRAEWIKFVAVFFGKEQQADSIFTDIETRYNDMKARAAKASYKPTIMAGSNFRGTWYMPGGRSYMGRLFADAGGAYYFANDTSSGSLPLNVETVLQHFSKADIWLSCSYNSTAELLAADSKHALFQPVKTGKVYNFNKRMLPSTANDFWESAVARPDLLLADVIAIVHPEILPGYEMVYGSPLNPPKGD